jgi:hypothetical protein
MIDIFNTFNSKFNFYSFLFDEIVNPIVNKQFLVEKTYKDALKIIKKEINNHIKNGEKQ